MTSFTLNTDLGGVTANSQFGIGLKGSFYLVDGPGGGSYYDALGQYQGTCSFPGRAVVAPYTRACYISTDSARLVYVFDSGTAFHQSYDASVVPEPETCALLALRAGIFLVPAHRRA